MQSEVQGKHLHFDCVSGIAGDMTLGALIAIGVPAQVIRDAIFAVGLGKDRLRVEEIVKTGIAATNVWVRCHEEGHSDESEEPVGAHSHKHAGHSHSHEDGDHSHHHYSEIRDRIENSGLGQEVIDCSIKIFDGLARAEGKLHGMAMDAVAFHEVGSIDSIVDVVGTAAALCWLQPSSISASPVAMGKGAVKCAHGKLPVPSPAAIEILCAVSAPITDGGINKELCTPTGAAILAAMVTDWSGMPGMTPIKIGYGAGDIDLPDRPNVLRVVCGAPLQKTPVTTETIVEVEANIDDMNPEICEYVSGRLFELGAVDVWWVPMTTKKSRPALHLHVLCPPSCTEKIVEAIAMETTSIGVRFQNKQRVVLEREILVVDTEYGEIPLKIARYMGKVVNAAPEYEACRVIAVEKGVALKLVFSAAIAAWHQQKTVTDGNAQG